MTTERLSSKIATLKDEMKRLKNLEARMLATPGQQISLADSDARWEHEHVLEDVQRRLDEHPEKMRRRRETVEHPFGMIKFWMGYTHFQMKTLKRVGTEMALHVLAYNLKRVMNIIGIHPLIAAMRAA
jgi:hypothetical protein